MPCYATGSAEGDARLSEQEAHIETTKVTDMLCRTLSQLEDEEWDQNVQIIRYLPKDVQRWWKEHKKLDKQRVIEEQKYKKQKIARLEKQLSDLKRSLKK